MDHQLDSFNDFILHKASLLREGKIEDQHLTFLGRECIGQYQSLCRNVDAQVRNLLNQSKQIKNKANNELLKLQTNLADMLTNFHVQTIVQVTPVLAILEDEALAAKLMKEIYRDPFEKYPKIELIEIES